MAVTAALWLARTTVFNTSGAEFPPLGSSAPQRWETYFRAMMSQNRVSTACAAPSVDQSRSHLLMYTDLPAVGGARATLRVEGDNVSHKRTFHAWRPC